MTLHGPRPEKRTLLDAHQCARHQAAYIDNDRFARIRRIRVARLSEPQKPVKEGEKVAKGQKIAEMGNTDASEVKLHFEIRRQGKPMDPTRYLPPA